MFIQGYTELNFIIPNYLFSPENRDKMRLKVWAASFKLSQDISPVFPYINAVADDAVFYENPKHIRLIFDGYRCCLYPGVITGHFFETKAAAKEFINHLIDYLNELYIKKDEITPNHDQVKQIAVTDILKILPKTNCKKCGYTTCMSFAADIIKGKTTVTACPDLTSPISMNAVYPVFDTKGDLIESVSFPMNSYPLKQDACSFGLSQREIEVLKLIAQGNTNNEIGTLLFISPHTVKSHMINIFNKLGVNDRTQAAVKATKAGLIH